MAATDPIDYESLKVTELKALLKERGIPSTGLTRKAQIIEALQVGDADETQASDDTAPVEGVSAPENGGAEDDAELAADAGASGEALDVATDKQDVGRSAEAESEDLPATEKEVVPQVDDEKAVTSAEENEVQDFSSMPRATPPEQAGAAESETQASAHVAEAPSDSQTPPAMTSEKESHPSSVDGAEVRKRKRRSPTPPIDEETVKKRLKSVDESELPKLPEDEPSDAPMREANATEQRAQEPLSSQADQMEQDLDIDVPPATHPATSALYIRDLLRPLQQAQLREHLVTLAAPPDTPPDAIILERLHLDALKTHAFAMFSSITAASRVRSRLHGKIWPEETNRKALWVDFIPEHKLQQWIDKEEAEGGSRSNAKRWEVVYTTTDDGDVDTELHEAQQGMTRQGSFTGQQSFGQGMPGAPAGPRGSRPSVPNITPAAPAPHEPSPSATKTPAFSDLDERYPSTTARPKLYFLPVASDLVDRRLDEIDSKTSRDWLDTGGRPVGGPSDQLRRYTFDDGDRLVDGGPDFGGFGRAKGAGGGDSFRPGGGRGGRFRRG